MLAESAVLGAFLAQDLILFVAFFDLMLIPFYFLIGELGTRPEGSTRVRATIKLVIYTLVGSLLMLAGGDRDRRARRPAERRRTSTSRFTALAAHAARAAARRSGSSCSSPPRSS